ncbi:ATP-binding cassette domain-containing protein [Alteromonas sp. H39]|uniref:ATP-binding cassette domain-containing protein n=1 Tax=Alteromonas sp. H39 TaxID=3389876 RepID=UPI0039DF3D83
MNLESCSVSLSPEFFSRPLTFSLGPSQHAIVVGPNGSGKSVLLRILAGEGNVRGGERRLARRIGVVSTARQQQLIAAEKQKDDADILDVVPVPTKVKDLLGHPLTGMLHSLCFELGLTSLFEQPFLSLSTGETRKLLFVLALASEPEVLILDDPWEGLDEASRTILQRHLEALQQRVQIVIAVNRLQDMPAIPAVLTVMDKGEVVLQTDASRPPAQNRAACDTWFHLQRDDVVLPATTAECSASRLNPDLPLVELKNGVVRFGDKTVFSELSWQINPAEHWQIIGPNGSGKTCLLTLITGDNPHCYRNNLTVFGIRRGSGESIWDIKQHIGMLSNAFHLSYRVNCAVIDVLLSGFFDSIGLYERPRREQIEVATAWLDALHMRGRKAEPFQSLSFGDQRLILIARAMIKHPPLLILDEPCNGLDPLNRLTVLALIEQLARHGRTTVLYVNHHKDDAIPSIQHTLNMQNYVPGDAH